MATEYIIKTELRLAIDAFGTTDGKFFFVELQPCSWERTELAQFQQTGNPEKPVKEIISIGEPGNDKEWKNIINALVKRLNSL
ncbi:MAG: hypothetical protein M3O71_15630 [Bacteroidota bacterium]|nr:hypothetical protein [Bacteroidota bacterium]